MAKSKNRTRNILIAVGVVLVLLVIARKSGMLGKEDNIRVTAEKVNKKTIVETVSASGKVQPEVEVKISADVSGEVVDIFVKEGDLVKKGMLLAKINPEIYKSALDRSVAAVNTSKANNENAISRLRQTESQFAKVQLDFNRSKKLFEDKVISAADFDAAKSNYEVARLEVEAAKQSVSASQYGVRSAEASLKEASENLNKASIFAPVNGTISKLSVEKGERVVGTEMMAGTEVMRLANLNEMEVSVDVSESDIIRVHLGDTASIDIDAYVNRVFKGIVTEIANSATSSEAMTTDQVTNYVVKVRILHQSYADLIPEDRPDFSPFRPGMSATVEIQTRKVYDVLSVPIQAVTTRDTVVKKSDKEVARREEGPDAEENKTKTTIDPTVISECVFVVKDEVVSLRNVKTGIQDNLNIQIIDGLKEGEEVVTGPYNAVSRLLKAGDKVMIVPKEELFTGKKE
ncbi:MAG TPA: efflux RND transporter periplasmic adaptor subunit [Bacteroidia bacterium]|nr:efflux RND transporter periplasmic adaptor subunit [Bacteroidia bacterium]